MQSYDFGSCYVKHDADTLVIGNSRIERAWRFAAGAPAPIRITDKTSGKEWLAAAAFVGSSLPGLGRRCGDPLIDTDNDLGLGEEALRVRIPFYHASGVWEWTHLVCPSAAFVRSYWEFVPQEAQTGEPTAATPADAATAVEAAAPADAADMKAPPTDTLDCFTLSPVHARWRSVLLRDVTDRNNNLVSEETGLLYGAEKRRLQGNLLFFRDTLDGAGLVIIKESATPLAQLRYPGHDFLLEGNRITISGSGISDADTAAANRLRAHGVAVGVCQNGDVGALFAVQEYHKAVRQLQPARDFFVMSNTWGDRSRDSRVSEAFIMEELPVAARLGVTIYQIDDGWQKGRTINSATATNTWEGFYQADPEFWRPDPVRFPRGLQPVRARAEELGIKLGLWFAPDSADDFAHWEDDANVLLGLHQEFGITYFKIDAVKLHSKLGEERLVGMLQRVIQRTGGQVAFNLDTTSGVRLGFYGRSHYGSLFLENRYTDLRNYYPHRTLRNLWMLSRYFPANRLQMEFLNVRRNTAKYADDPLAPANVGVSYAFGTTVCANPLAWMELTGLHEDDQEQLAKLIPAYRRHQEAMLSGVTLPIGDEPDGTRWTGFQCITDERAGYLVFYRELSRSTRHRFRLFNLESCRIELEPVMGIAQERRLEVDGRGETWVTLPQPMSFAVYRYF